MRQIIICNNCEQILIGSVDIFDHCSKNLYEKAFKRYIETGSITPGFFFWDFSLSTCYDCPRCGKKINPSVIHYPYDIKYFKCGDCGSFTPIEDCKFFINGTVPSTLCIKCYEMFQKDENFMNSIIYMEISQSD